MPTMDTGSLRQWMEAFDYTDLWSKVQPNDVIMQWAEEEKTCLG